MSSVLDGGAFPKDINHSARAEIVSGTVFAFLKYPAVLYTPEKWMTNSKDLIKCIQPTQFNSSQLCVEFQEFSDRVGKGTGNVESMYAHYKDENGNFDQIDIIM